RRNVNFIPPPKKAADSSIGRRILPVSYDCLSELRPPGEQQTSLSLKTAAGSTDGPLTQGRPVYRTRPSPTDYYIPVSPLPPRSSALQQTVSTGAACLRTSSTSLPRPA